MTLPWMDILLATFVGVALVMLYRMHRDRTNRFDALDLIVDHNNNRASLDKLILLGFALLSSWVIVVLLDKGKDVETILLGVLAVFILKRTADKAMDAYTNVRTPPPAEPPLRDIGRG